MARKSRCSAGMVGIREYIDVHNEDPKPFRRTRAAGQILDSMARYARRTLATTTA